MVETAKVSSGKQKSGAKSPKKSRLNLKTIDILNDWKGAFSHLQNLLIQGVIDPNVYKAVIYGWQTFRSFSNDEYAKEEVNRLFVVYKIKINRFFSKFISAFLAEVAKFVDQDVMNNILIATKKLSRDLIINIEKEDNQLYKGFQKVSFSPKIEDTRDNQDQQKMEFMKESYFELPISKKEEFKKWINDTEF